MSDTVSVAVYGLGSIGTHLSDVLIDKDGFELQGAVDIDPEIVGTELGEVLDREPVGITVTDDHEQLHSGHDIDVSLITTTSFFDEVRPLVEQCIQAGTDIVSTSEEMFFPTPDREDVAAELDSLAKEHGVTVVGTGMNPGFIFDSLPLLLSSVCTDVSHIQAERFANLSPYETAQSRFGAGLPLEEYRERLQNDEIQTHVGMEESLRGLEYGLGIVYDEIQEHQEPIIATEDRETPYIEIPAGTVAGIRQRAFGIIDDVVFASLEVTVEAIDNDVEKTGRDQLRISGTPEFEVTVDPSFKSVEGTTGRSINIIPQVLEANPGYKSVFDLPSPAAVVSGGALRSSLDR